MGESDERGPPIIGLPERLDRRMRLGPFPTSHDALKFLLYSAVGALLVPFASPLLWVPVVLLGFGVSVWRPDGRALDERAFSFLRWKSRTRAPIRRVGGAMHTPLVRQGLFELAPHRYVAVVRTGGTPVAYLPPDDLARRFELFREVLRSTDDHIAFLATTVPIRSQSMRPVPRSGVDPDALALAGYAELVSLLCRRRQLRRVFFVIGAFEGTPDAIGHLENSVANLIERLSALGLRPARLRDRSLAEAMHRFGWPVGAVRK